MIDFAKTIKDLRHSFDLTQKELAEKLGYSTHIICNWESKRSNPSIDDLVKVADFFQVSVDYLLEREDDFGNKICATSFQQLPAEEVDVLTKYRKLTEFERKAIIMQLTALSDKK